MWIKRDLAAAMRAAAHQRPVLLVTGARQTGKTALSRRAFPRHGYVSLDLPRLAEEAEYSGEQFLARHPPPVIIDEIQYAPKLFRYLKHAVDSRRGENGLYVVTGSQAFGMMEGVSESLAGRVAVLELHTLSLGEIEKSSGRTAEGRQLLEWMLTGGYPEIHATSLDPQRFYSDYVATYLERDVRHAIQVRDLRDFDRFLRLAAVRTSQILSLSSLASDVGVSPNTIKSWLSVLEASHIVHLLEPYFENIGKRIVKSPKLYFLDTGLACFLAGIETADQLRQSALLGAFFETLVLGQFIRQQTARGGRPRVCFYRDQRGMEVDFVVPVGEKVRLFECKWAEMPDTPRSLTQLAETLGPKRVLSASVVTPVRGRRRAADGTTVTDCVELHLGQGS